MDSMSIARRLTRNFQEHILLARKRNLLSARYAYHFRMADKLNLVLSKNRILSY